MRRPSFVSAVSTTRPVRTEVAHVPPALLAAITVVVAATCPPLAAESDARDAAPAADAVTADADAEPVARRPSMRQLGPGAGGSRPPSRREAADGRTVVRRRFHEEYSHTETSLGARLAAETLLAAAATEEDRTLRWVLLDEARRLGESSGQAGIISRAYATAAGFYAFDDVAAELRSLEQIPVRVLDGGRAAALAKAAEQLARRAADDNRMPQAIAAESIAVRAWQRAGNTAAAREAAARTVALERQ